jgi:HSP20 family protein
MLRRIETWAPFSELDDLGERMKRLFPARWAGDGGRELLALADWVPSCNVMEDAKEFRIRVELPDVRKEDVHVSMQDGTLTIEGERKEEKEEKGIKFYRRELSYGKFVRRFTMPEEVDESKVQAIFENGMLMVTVAKAKVLQPRAKEIPVA